MVRIKDVEFENAINNSLLHGDMEKVWTTVSDNKNFHSVMTEDMIQRAKERIIRAQLSSSNGDIAEEHDQFYRDHKLLLVLFRALAVMPITRSSPGRVTFSWKSGATIYAILFYIAATIVVLTVGYERIKILETTKKFDDYIYAIVFIIFLVPHFWVPFVGWGVASHVAVYKTMWGSFQVRYYRVTGRSLQFPRLKILIVIISTGCLLCAILFLLSLTVLLEGKNGYFLFFLAILNSVYIHSISVPRILFVAYFGILSHCYND